MFPYFMNPGVRTQVMCVHIVRIAVWIQIYYMTGMYASTDCYFMQIIGFCSSILEGLLYIQNINWFVVPKNPQEELAVYEVSDTVKVHLALIPGENCKSLENKHKQSLCIIFSHLLSTILGDTPTECYMFFELTLNALKTSLLILSPFNKSLRYNNKS